jgi:nucleotide-binding universal stress UspA family protein
MAFDDALLFIDSYPDATPREAVEAAVALAAQLKARLSALALEIRIPLQTNRLVDYLIGLSGTVAAEEAKSEAGARAALAHFRHAAEAAGVCGETLSARADIYGFPEVVAHRARTRDACFCILPRGERDEGQRDVVAAAVFKSGRPVIVLPEAPPPRPALERIAVAWDGGRAAARALADALPLLVAAREVRIFTVLGDKPGAQAGVGAEAARHLRRHGVDPAVDEIARGDGTTGEAFEAYLDRHAPGFLVMGAFAHSRLQEFVLGGATHHMLRDPRLPLLLAH